MVRVLVSDGETPAAVAVVRSLGSAGHRVWALAASRHAAAAASRWCRGAVAVPDAAIDPAGWRARVGPLLARRRFDLFLPVTDAALLLAAGLGPVRALVGGPIPEGLDALLDKTRVLDRAAALGIPVLPRRTGDSIGASPLPAVLKPRRSRVRTAGGVRAATAAVFCDRDALARAAAALERAGFGAYAEPWVPGPGRGIFLLLHRGEVLARFAHRRVREASPLGGPSAVCESAPADPRREELSAALARDLGVGGPFMAEYRGEGDDAVLLEVNARYWGSLGLAVDAGVDFPRLHAAALLGRPERGPGSWPVGLRRRNLVFDLRGLAGVLRGRPRGLDVPWPGRLRTLRRVLGERAGGLVRRPADPAPGRAHLLRLLGRALRRG